MQPISSGVILSVSGRICFLASAFLLTGFLGSLNPISSHRSYSVSQLPLGVRAMQWPVRKAELQKMDTFNLKGSLETHSYQNKGLHVGFKWEQNGRDYKLQFLDPKDKVFLEMVGNSKKVRLCSQNKTYSSKDAELLLKKHLGVSIPLNYFKDWLRGIPSPGLSNERVFNPTKHLLTLNQAGWLIRYLRYHRVRKIDLPTQLFMTKNDRYVRVLVTHWKL